jgi:hypothetical protein
LFSSISTSTDLKFYLLFVILSSFQISYGQLKLKEDQRGRSLKEFYLSLQVESHWISGQHVDWETGEPDNPTADQDIHTHCSAFVASACKKLNIYILRPPEHPIQLLANAQYDWLLSTEARQKGWEEIPDGDIYLKAQDMANKGYVVIAICRNNNQLKPGHVALVRPAEINQEDLESSGPILIMAGTHNFNYISLKSAFSSHISGWPEREILFYYNKLSI